MSEIMMRGSTNPSPFALGLSKGCPDPLFQRSEEGQCFDKLSTNGKARSAEHGFESSKRSAEHGFTPFRRTAENGFTLVELMVVIVIIGLLTTLVVINVLPSQDKAMRKKAEADIATITQALEMYRLDKMSYPATGDGLAVLASGGASGGYIRKLPDDPWGRPYRYANPGRSGGVDVWSLGADGAEGGEGDNADIGLAR